MVLRPVFLLAALSLLSACTPESATRIVKPYRIDVRQGNYVTREMLAQLTPGMSREQVRFVLGSPLLVDVFHPDRWDYVYQFSKSYAAPERRAVTVFFANDKFVRVEGDIVPAAGDLPEVPVTPRVIDITGPAGSKAKP